MYIYIDIYIYIYIRNELSHTILKIITKRGTYEKDVKTKILQEVHWATVDFISHLLFDFYSKSNIKEYKISNSECVHPFSKSGHK